MPNVIPPEVPGPVAGAAGHFPHHDWLTASVKALDAQAGVWVPYTPVLTATTTNPVLGTGGVAIAKYLKLGSILYIKGSIRFGTAGTNAGSGSFGISSPIAVYNTTSSSFVPMGMGNVNDSSAGTILTTFCYVAADGDLLFRMRPLNVTSPVGSATIPWAASDRIDFFAQFECLP